MAARTMTATRLRTLRRAVLLLALTLSASACLGTETEVVSASDSVKLTGNRFTHDDEMAHQQTVYTWDEKLRGYIDPEKNLVVRFGRLKGNAYLAQGAGQREAAGVFLLTIVRVSPPRIHVQSPRCLGLADESPWLARGHGVELEDRSTMGGLTGSRGGILGFFLSGVECGGGGALDIRIVPDVLSPGGRELADDAVPFDRAHRVPFFNRMCDRGETDACYKASQAYLRGEGVARNTPRAAALLETACAAEYMRACLDLAVLLDAGDGVTKDSARAAELLRRACDGEEPYACELLKTRR